MPSSSKREVEHDGDEHIDRLTTGKAPRLESPLENGGHRLFVESAVQ
jgi:hypothetical protein